ncbi:Homoserine dehydrogenase [Rhodosporidiobolus nylandii]
MPMPSCLWFRQLVKHLAGLASSGDHPVIFIDCTSDLAVASLYPRALSSGVSVVTPNKKGFASSADLYNRISEAQKSPRAFCCAEATVGAGLPIHTTLRDLLSTGDEITKIEGVFSGTLSYLFNQYSPATKAERDQGYVSVPTQSLIPAALGDIEDASEFVARLPGFDADFDAMRDEAAREGRVLRYVGVIDCAKGQIKCGLRKYPTSHPFASLTGSHLSIAFWTKRYSERPLIVQGPGYPLEVTASAVVADCIRVAERCGARLGL